MAPKAMNQAAIERRLITERVTTALEQARTACKRKGTKETMLTKLGPCGGASCLRIPFREFMKCNPTVFHGHEGAVELSRWFEKTEMVFGISECAEARKVKFAAAPNTQACLTWWDSSSISNCGKQCHMWQEIVRQSYQLRDLMRDQPLRVYDSEKRDTQGLCGRHTGQSTKETDSPQPRQVIRDFPEVFPETLPGLSTTRSQVEF
ncbi:hypothetical protein Tco_1314094 [Tanacetum coccineum]